MEIERKYLVDKLPQDLDRYSNVEIEQGYLCASPTIRIRKVGVFFILTIKEKCVSNSTAIHNREEEFMLSRSSYDLLKAKCDGFMISKTRYRIPIGNLMAELDIFHGAHEGLQIVEVEFPDTQAADSFQPPEWFGADVSTDVHYSNSYLAFN